LKKTIKKKKIDIEPIEHEVSSGNVFADLGLQNPEERLAKADLAIQINELIDQKGLTQAQAAKLLEIDQPKVSALSRGRLSGFSLERLFKFLNILGQDVIIEVTPKKRATNKAQLSVISRVTKKKPVIQHRDISAGHASKQAKKKK